MPASNTQALYGDDVRVFDVAEGWAWIQAERDGYVGYVADSVLAERSRRADARRHRAAHLPLSRPRPEAAATGELSMGSRVAVTGIAETRGTRYALLASGEAMIAKHLAPLGRAPPATMSRSPRR